MNSFRWFGRRIARWTCLLSSRGCLATSLLLIVTVAMLLGSQTAQAKNRERVVNIVMEDQFRNRCETGGLRGDVVVLVYADRKGATAGQALGRRLHVHFHPTAERASAAEWARQPVVGLPGWPADLRVPDVRVVPVACLSEVPKPLQPVARAHFRSSSPVVPVWLDFGDTMQRTFGMTHAVENVAIIDTQGQVYGVLSGHFDGIRFQELVGSIDLLRRQAPPDARTTATPVNATQ